MINNPTFDLEHVESSPKIDEPFHKMDSVSSPNPSTSTAAAVTVRNAYKSYGKSIPVLKNLSMTVKEGTIYSLLGSSGCGKTTLLSAIVGLKLLDSGQIQVFGQTPGTPQSGIPGRAVGHMPQEYALYPDFSVKESLSYFGRIYGMSQDKVRERSEFLIKFLDLPKPSRRIITLSGGQKRRVSLAIAMIHEPRLLILDEPTVGVDHLLRESIWNLLRGLVSNGNSTVIITTHYIEESRASERIGLMRNGRLLTEKSPNSLLQEYNTNLLEDVVLSLSRYDGQNELDVDDEDKEHTNAFGDVHVTVLDKSDVDSVIVLKPTNINAQRTENPEINSNSNGTKPVLKLTSTQKSPKSIQENINNNVNDPTPQFSFPRFGALVNKNLILLFRNYIFLLFNFLTPSLQMIIMCLAIGNDPTNLPFAVVNHENPYTCQQALMVNTTLLNQECTPSNWSCIFLDTLSTQYVINLIPYETESLALADVQKGYLWGYMSFPQNFSQDLFDRGLAGGNPTEESVVGSSITLKMDFSSETIAAILQKTLLRSFDKFATRVLTDCGFDSRAAQLPIKYDDPVYGTQETNYREYIAPSLLLSILFFLPLTASGIAYISDRKAGTLDRGLVAGVTTFEIMLANMFSQILVLFVQALMAFMIMTHLFHIHVQGSVFSALVLSILIGISGMSMGFLVSTIVTEEIQAVIIAIGTFFPNFALAGMVWPVEGMPLFLQYLGYFLPCTLASESMRSIVSRGLPLFHYKVWPGFLTTLGWIVIYWILTISFHKISSRRR